MTIVLCDANTDSHRNAPPIIYRNNFFLYSSANFLCNSTNRDFRRLNQHDQELFPSEPEHIIPTTNALRNQGGDTFYNFVPHCMAVAIIYKFEAIYIYS